MTHIPVLVKEVLQYLDPKPNENFIDCTVGEGGHTAAILEKNKPNGKVLGIDLDPQADLMSRLILINDSYINLQEIVEKINFKPINGILLDLGMSSVQLEKSGRGFTFLKDEPLDMRYAPEITNLTAEKIINEWPEEEIKRILEEYGEEKFSRQIARKIIEERNPPAGGKKIKSTFQLVEVIKKAKFQYGRIHCATKTFQALRIAVNDELGNLKRVLPQAISVLSSGGRLVVISFHSLEDRIVKNFFKEQSEQGIVKILLKKPITASEEERGSNPRSRSAKLRAIIKL